MFCVLLFFFAYLHQHDGWNQNSRLDLLHSIWTHHTFNIDAYHFNTGDKSVYDGHYYSDKAPGIVLLALPAFMLSALMLKFTGMSLDAAGGWEFADWFATVGSVGWVTALGGMVFYRMLRNWMAARLALFGGRSTC